MGVSRSTVQRYCDSGVLRLHRTLGGHRRLYAEDVIRWLKDSQAKKRRPRTPSSDSRDKLTVKTVANALLDGKLNRLESLSNRVLIGEYGLGKLCDDFLQPAREYIAERRVAGKITTVEEWRSLLHLEQFLTQMTKPHQKMDRPVAVGATIGNDPLDVGSRMLETVLRNEDFEAFHAGANLSSACLAEMVQRLDAQWVWISYEQVEDYAATVSHARVLHNELPPGCRLLIMGSALNATLLKFLPREFVLDSFQSLVELIALQSQRQFSS